MLYLSPMSKYASLLFAPDEHHKVGPFRFPVYHDLVPGEAKGLEAISRKQSRHTFSSIKLAQKIAKDKKITTKEAVDLLGASNEDNQDIFYEYAHELEELQQMSMGAAEQKISMATLFLRYRGEVLLPETKEWKTLSDWQEEDTENIPWKLLEQIVDFITWERDGWPEKEGNEDQKFSPPRKSS